MGAKTNAGGIFGHTETEEEDEDGEDVGHVPAETEDVHRHDFLKCDEGEMVERERERVEVGSVGSAR